MADVNINDCGSVVMITPITPAGREWGRTKRQIRGLASNGMLHCLRPPLCVTNQRRVGKCGTRSGLNMPLLFLISLI